MKSYIATRAAATPAGGARPPASLYMAGPFSMGYLDFFTFLIPLYGLSLGFDASEIGILVGARSILALFLSIHIGVLMDRFGTRAVTLVFVWTGMVLAPLFPLATGFWALLFLQLVNGAAVSFAWSGAQTLIAQLAEGDARYIGRFSFFARLGSTSAPIVAGAVWDLGGAWPADLLGAAWGAVLTTALLRTPEAEFFTPQPASRTNQNRFRARDVWPRASDYVSAIKLIALPAVAVSMAVISMRNTTYSLQTSVYVVYLDQIALVGTTIGMLFAAAEIASGFGALFAGRAMRLGNPQRTMLRGTVLSILLIAATPLLGGLFGLLLLFQVARGWLEGVIQPVILSVQARASPAGRRRWAAPDGAAAQLDPDPAHNGRDRRPLRDEPKLSDLRRLHVAALRPARAHHPSSATAWQRRYLTPDWWSTAFRGPCRAPRGQDPISPSW